MLFRNKSAACLLLALCMSCSVALGQARGPKTKPPPTPLPLAKSGQTTSYWPGDDGSIQAGAASPIPRFSDNGNGTVTDRLTNLLWTKDAGQYIIYWGDALDYCTNYPTGGNAGWRMPNIRELMSLMDFERKFPMLPSGHPFTNVQGDVGNTYYWTSTTNSVYDTFNDAYGVNLGSGEVRIWPKRSGGYIVCVHDQ